MQSVCPVDHAETCPHGLPFKIPRESQVLSFQGTVHNQLVNILIDSGCTNNFVSTHLVQRLKLRTTRSAHSSTIELADGSKLQCNARVPGLAFSIQHYRDRLDFEVMPLSLYDMILGQTWLYQYDPQISFRSHSIQLLKDRHPLELFGAFNDQPIPMISALQVKRLVRKRHCQAALIYVRAIKDDSSSSATSYLQQPFFKEFHDLFPDELPEELPPRRTVDHPIDLFPGSQPSSRAPYRVSFTESQEIQKQLQDLLDKGHIRPSKSPFGAPVLLVKKKDGSMRLCIDY